MSFLMLRKICPKRSGIKLKQRATDQSRKSGGCSFHPSPVIIIVLIPAVWAAAIASFTSSRGGIALRHKFRGPLSVEPMPSSLQSIWL
jgi:hypothetical protein